MKRKRSTEEQIVFALRQAHSAIVVSSVVAKPDELRGEIVKAYATPPLGHEPTEALQVNIHDFVKKLTAPYQYSRDFEFRSELPKDRSG